MIFTNVIKPTHLCNLACRYCYNEDERNSIMSEAIMKLVIQETFRYCREIDKNTCVDFIWHGGEPLLAGLDFFEKVIIAQQLYSNGMKYSNSVQTNGTLINEKWIDFFQTNKFRVSISIDGPRDINDAIRLDKGQKGSFDRIIQAIGLVKKAGLSLGVAVVISQANYNKIDELYDFLCQKQLPFNVIPLNYAGSARKNFVDLSISPLEFAKAWIKLYDKWFYGKKNKYVYCSDFAFKTRSIMEKIPVDCIGSENCSKMNITTGPSGKIYPCATLSSDEEWCYGNIEDAPLSKLFESRPALRAQKRIPDPECLKCRWQKICHGGCMARSVRFFKNYDKRDFYCAGFRLMYEHVLNRLKNESDLKIPDY
jgi:uncharacterized protein